MSAALTPPALVVFGPTASGKSLYARRLAEAHNGEIIACDAVMVYCGFDIGSNKPSANERAAIRHHGLDLCTANDPFTAADYASMGEQALADIVARGRRPVVVVGTFLYFRALFYGLGPLPPGDPALRAALMAQEQQTPGFLSREVERVDPASFAEAHGRNLPRLLRALEVFRLSGKAAGEWRREHGFSTVRYPFIGLGLRPDRNELRARIATRTAAMLSEGLLGEVEGLRAQGLSRETKPMQAIGYKQVNAHLDGALDGADLASAIALATGQYAKRQLSFFGKEPSIRWFEGFGDRVTV